MAFLFFHKRRGRSGPIFFREPRFLGRRENVKKLAENPEDRERRRWESGDIHEKSSIF